MPGVGGFGGTQIIRGTPYTMYTPAWYAAMDADKIANAKTSGEAAASQAGAAITGLRSQVPDLFGNDSSSTSSSSSGTSPGSSLPRVSMGGAASIGAPAPAAPTGLPAGYTPGGATTAPVTLRPTDTSAADAARFGKAKDTVGQTTRASLTALRSALGSRGQLGGGGEFHGTSAILTKGQGELGDTARAQAVQASDADQARAALEYTGGITQRGQNMTAAEAADSLAARLREVSYQGDITQRGQDIAAMHDAQTQTLLEKQQQQAVLDRILNALNPLY